MNLEQRFRAAGRDLRLADFDPSDDAGLDKATAERLRAADLERMRALQERLYAEGRQALLVVVQALDAAGKDGTISHVMSGVNPQGVRVTSFKQPSSLELAHDWLWRCSQALPRHGEIGIFNRSHYEEVLVLRVHPEHLAGQGVDPERADAAFWTQRLKTIAAWERHLGTCGTHVVKFFLHVSREVQRERFLARAAEQDKHWKFNAGDVAEREHWDAYHEAYEQAIRATSTEDAPWYVIPADRKWLMRTAVAGIIVEHLERMDPRFPEVGEADRARMDAAVAALEVEGT
ncbi:MAG TPA: PPK2 family polyphosphate kinase [Solirubrobacteraceae bacterium]